MTELTIAKIRACNAILDCAFYEDDTPKTSQDYWLWRVRIHMDKIEKTNDGLNGRGKLPYFSRYVDFNNSIRILTR